MTYLNQAKFWIPFAALLGLAGCEAFKDPEIDPAAIDTGVVVDGPIDDEPDIPTTNVCPSFPQPGVDPAAPYQKALYFWASSAEVEEMRATGDIFQPRDPFGLNDPFLLLTVKYEKGQYVGTAQGAAAQILAATQSRAAWPYPWANRFPASFDGDNNLRDQLVRIVLRDDAWFTSETLRLLLQDADRTAVSEDQRMQAPGRFAGVLHELNNSGDCGTQSAVNPSRTYTLISPDAVESWSVGSDAATNRVAADAFALQTFLEEVRGFNQILFAGVSTFSDDVVCGWENTGDEICGGGAYLDSLTNAEGRYFPDASNLASLVDMLRTIPKAEPYEHVVVHQDTSMGGAPQ